MKKRLVIGSATILLASGCSGSHADVPSGAAAYQLMPPPADEFSLRNYRIHPGDRLSVTVYREPELSLPAVEVDISGQFSIPLIGPVDAAGKTAVELARSIQDQLAAKYLVDPNVTVNIASAARQRVIVDGSVGVPGVYEVRGQMTLMGALALARGPNVVAKLDEIAIFRQIDGQLVGAKFDLEEIRMGRAPDPEILPNDTVVVGFSGMKQAWRDFLQAIPAIGLFRPLID